MLSETIDALPASASALPSAVPHAADPVQEVVIRPRSGWVEVNWAELYASRELLFFLVWRDIKIRYKQTVIGAGWAVLQPLVTLAIFTVIFGRLAGMDSEGFPYPVFAVVALVPWTFFANGIAQAAQSLVNQQQLLTKVYFPRLFIPTGAVLSFLVDFTISMTLSGTLLLYYRQPLSPWVVTLPFLVALTVLATLGIGLFLAALTVFYRDFRYVVPFLVQILMYVSPVIYSSHILPSRYRWILGLNPMAGIIEGYRSAILGAPWELPLLAVSTVVTLGLFAGGLSYFRLVERRFADIA